MNQKVIRYIISLMVVSLLGIISFQAYWIYLKVNEKAEEFDQKVYRSLAQIRDDLEEKEAFVFIQKSQAEINSIHTSELIHQAEDEIDELTEIIVSGSNNFSYLIEADDSSDKNSTSNFKIIQDSSNSSIEAYVLDGSDINLKYISKGKKLGKPENELIKIYTQKKDKLETVIRKMAFDFAFQDEQLHFRIKKLNLDSTIAENLKSEGVLTTNYKYFIKDRKNDSIIFKSSGPEINAAENVFVTSILENGESKNGGTLGIAFENKTNFIIQSIGLTLLISALLTLIMIFTFSYTIHSIVKEKKLSRIKADFINNMTHEFKTPIATISLAVDSMLHPLVIKEENEIERFGGIIKKENERMNRQIESVLNAARFEQQTVELKQEKINLNLVIIELCQDFKLKTSSQSGDIKLNLTDKEVFLIGDEMHFYNAIRNLIDNAIKFSNIDFRVLISTTINEGQISIVVSDQGIGMDKKTQKHAFDRFFRKSEGNLHTTKGFGLGLNYVQEIITRMNGEIYLESELGKGTKVIIKLKTA